MHAQLNEASVKSTLLDIKSLHLKQFVGVCDLFLIVFLTSWDSFDCKIYRLCSSFIVNYL